MFEPPSLAPVPFPLLRALYEATEDHPYQGPVVEYLLIVAPEWAFQICTECHGPVQPATSWRGLYWLCEGCGEKGAINDELHDRIARALQPKCPQCNTLLSNKPWRAGNYLPCTGCEFRTNWQELQDTIVGIESDESQTR